MNSSHLVFHHFGLAVRRPDEARKFLAGLGYQLGNEIFDANQNVHLQMGTHASQPAVEIIWPGIKPGPVDRLASRFTSGIVYHICYATTNLKSALAGFQSDAVKCICISPPTPAPLFDGRLVSFYNISGIGLIEILETV